MPEKLIHNYQYYTQANMDRLRAAGCDVPSMTLQEGVKDFVTNYLVKDDPYL
jgi:ADP-L-glycero-D-manno-heptose 6-epimerase